MPNRLYPLNAGRAMVVTDLHGAGDVYERLRDRFLWLRARGDADMLVICGDLIHTPEEDDPDDSLPMLLDVMRLRAELGPERVILLLGNHEMPHIYGVTLAKGERVYTPAFEAALAALGTGRQAVMDFLMDLPLYVATRAGVLLTHAGAASDITSTDALKRLLALDHRALLKEADARLAGAGIEAVRAEYERRTRIGYEQQAAEMLAVTGPNDPRYDDLLRGQVVGGLADFDLLWQALFSRNEYDGGEAAYNSVVSRFLNTISTFSAYPQHVLIAGHLAARGGYSLIGIQQLRLASYAHAKPEKAGRYLLLDCEKPVKTNTDLAAGLRPVFG